MNNLDFRLSSGNGTKPRLASNKINNYAWQTTCSIELGRPVFLLAFVVAVILLTFTSIPLQFRFLAPFLLVPLVTDLRRGAESWLVAAAVFTGIQCLIGSCYVCWTGDGTLTTTCYPALREFVIGIIVITALNGRSFKAVMLFITIWIALQGCALGLEMAGADPTSLVPFPIFNAKDAGIHQSFLSQGRYGGFTYEAGILGGMASIFLLLVVPPGYLILRNRPRLSFKLLTLILIAISLMGILALTLTKSGIFTISVALVVFLGVSALTGDLRSVVAAFVCMGIAMLVVMAAMDNNPTASNYSDQEVERLDSFLATGDISGIRDSGLATRVQCARLAFLGVPDFPFGLGLDGLKTYLGKHFNNVLMTPEMKESFANDNFGLKGYFFNILAMSGVLGVLLMLWMVLVSVKPYVFASRRRSLAIPASIAAGLVALSLSAELMPFVGLCAFVYSAGMALKRQRLAMASEKSLPVGRSISDN